MSSREISGPVFQFILVVNILWLSELSFLTIAIPGRRFSLHFAIFSFLTARNHDFSSGNLTCCSQDFSLLYVRLFLASGRLRNSSATFVSITSIFVGPRHGISLTFPCHSNVDGLNFPRCCVLVALDFGSRLVIVILTSWPVKLFVMR